MNAVPASARVKPIGAIEKMPRPGRPACCKTWLAMRNAGAPMMVIVVPREAANERGISSLDGGTPRARERVSVTGSISAVVVR